MQLAACPHVLIIVGRLLLNRDVCSNFSVYKYIDRHNFHRFVKVPGLLFILRDVLLDNLFFKKCYFKSEKKQFSFFFCFFLHGLFKTFQRWYREYPKPEMSLQCPNIYISVRHFSKLKSSNCTFSKYINSQSKNKRTKNWTGKNSCQNF